MRYNSDLLPSVSVTAPGMFHGAKYTHTRIVPWCQVHSHIYANRKTTSYIATTNKQLQRQQQQPCSSSSKQCCKKSTMLHQELHWLLFKCTKDPTDINAEHVTLVKRASLRSLPHKIYIVPPTKSIYKNDPQQTIADPTGLRPRPIGLWVEQI